MMDIGVGLIGYGLAGRAFHAPYVGATPGMTLRAVVSRDPAKVHADLPGMTVAPDVPTLLAMPDVDLVIVASPDELHAEHALAALAAGRHVLIDKPFATSLADARRIAAEGEARDRIVTVFHNRRWDADFRTLQKLIADGTLGEIVEYESRFDRWRPTPADSWKEARGSGPWQDLGPHLIDQALMLFGRPLAVSTDLATFRAGGPAPDYVSAVLRYPDKRVVLHASKLVADYGLRFAVHGTRGSWIKHGTDVQEAKTVAGQAPAGEDWGHDPVEGRLTCPDDGAGARALANEPGDYRLFWLALAAAIRDEGPNPVPASAGIAVLEILEAGLRSAAERREIML
ncbi:oxidoreductase [Sphingomonas sp. BIUV-7]|uniref:Oxidoreductase n=1 Tax=Sphingomonas natans TaxID=3063330 RepID=A0ABT8Y5E6_9SPHN|nr:oxidoreductase [Sphingomonas sp. BIUV-7]MDO6413540.1 oxidoreductase [Sphingomonas sp. BIUV-7]